MSLSGLFAAKKRVETSVKKYEIPTEETAVAASSSENGVLLLSLLQSRLNWANYVFPKYKPDPIQQPKRTNTSRKKWPCMKYLGTCTLQLGVHMFEQTCFYQAIREESWISIAKSENLLEDSTVGTENMLAEKLVYNDIVFELNEASNERFIFPKEVIIESAPEDQGDFTICASFVLPLDQSIAESFFDTTNNKLLKFGKTCGLDVIKNYANLNSIQETKTLPATEVYQPVNIRITKASKELVEALEKTVDNPMEVTNIMKEKIKQLPKKKYIKFDLSNNAEQKDEIADLIQKTSTVPDITTGPIQVEKKRNEILNAIKLGKRPRDEKFEADLPKNKSNNGKDDGLLKCAYCSTKHTYMWRPGPGGQGTLCNSCGIQWRRGEILVDAPVISKEEELKLLLERREKEKIAEAAEAEKTERETKKQVKKVDRQDIGGGLPQFLQRKNHASTSSSPAQDIPTDNNVNNSNALKLNDSKKKVGKSSNKAEIMEKVKKSQSIKSKIATEEPPATQKEQGTIKSVPLSLYSAAGIPLPTLSIDLANTMQFSHPNCGITLLDRFFSVRLCKDGCEQTTIEFDKNDLMTAQFEVVTEGEPPLQREILKMKITPQSKSVIAFDQTLTIDQTHPICVRFLEKLDPNGGAVVQRILQRWLVIVPQ